MARREILTWPDPKLRETCAPAGSGGDTETLVIDLFETMYDAPGRGLAAPQIGVMARVFVTDTTWKEGICSPMAFVNPKITAMSDVRVSGPEGCLSIPGLLFDIARPEWVDMAWETPAGESMAQRFDGFAAACVCHELDHLNGVVTFDHLSDDARVEAARAYEAMQA